MSRTPTNYYISDTHFAHRNIVVFTDNNGNKIREFETYEEHDEAIIKNVNSIVKPQDRLYICGDVAISKRGIENVGRLNGRKVLIKGNHDIFKLKDYTSYFDDIRSYKMIPKHGVIVSHIPIRLEPRDYHRWGWNVHGHTHHNVIDDPRYINICLEHTNMFPVSFDEILETIKEREEIMFNMQDNNETLTHLTNWK